MRRKASLTWSRRVALAAACAIALLAGWPSSRASAQTRWTMATEYPESNISGTGLATFAKAVAENTHGFVTTVIAFDNEMKISNRELIRAAQDHRVDGGDAFAGPLESSDPVFGLPSLPFVVQSVETAKTVAARARPLYERALAARGLKLLYITIWPSTGLWSDRALTSPDDMRALSVRTFDDNSAAVMRALGASAEYVPMNEAIPKVRAHTLNAVLTSGDGGVARQLWGDLHHFTPINYAIPVSIAFVRQDGFEALPQDTKTRSNAPPQRRKEASTTSWPIAPPRITRGCAPMA